MQIQNKRNCFYYGYVYGKTGFVDFTDPTLFSLENWVILTIQ
jgi:hypothetical protein